MTAAALTATGLAAALRLPGTGRVVTAAPSSGDGQFLGVDWGSIALVFVVAMVATVAIVTVYALGLRLLSVRTATRAADHYGDGLDGGWGVGSVGSGGAGEAGAGEHRPLIASLGAFACIGIGAAGVLFGIYLIVPQFH